MSRKSLSCALVRSIAVGVALLLVVPCAGAADVEKVLDDSRTTAVSLSADGKQVVCNAAKTDNFNGTEMSILQLRNVADKKGETASDTLISRAKRFVTFLALSPDDRTWASLFEGKVQLWDRQTLKVRDRLELKAIEVVNQFVFLDRSTLLLAGSTGGSAEGTLKLWDVKTNKEIAGFKPPAPVLRVAINAERTTLVLFDDKDTVRLWSVTKKDDKFDLKEESSLTGHKGVTCFAVSPDGKQYLTGGSDKRVRLWDKATSKELAVLVGHADTVEFVVFAADGKTPISGSRDGSVRLWDVEGDKEKKVWKREGFLTCFHVAPDGTKVVTGGEYGVLVWDVAEMSKESQPGKEK